MTIKLSLKKIRQIAVSLVFLLIAGFIGYRIGISHSLDRAPVKKADLSLFWLVWHQLEEKYLEKEALDPQKMIEGAIEGMVASLGDPYTVFLPPADNKINKEDLSGEFGGVGIQLGYKDHTLAVIAPLKGTPAEKAGIKAGDLILGIKDKTKGIDRKTDGISLPEAVKLIRGKEGTVVTLTLARKGVEKPFEVAITRGRIVIPAIESHWIEQGGKRLAYVHLFQFSERMNQEWTAWANEVVKKKDQANFGGVILDLRNNPGGYLQGAVFVAGEFLPRGTVVVWQENYQQEKDKLAVDRQGQLLSVPLVVLVNQGSASAAEILAGALQEHHRARVVGGKTFGKGTVQVPEDLPRGAGLHITVARWLLPSGESIHKKGIKPDIVVEATESGKIKEDPVLEKGAEVLISNFQK